MGVLYSSYIRSNDHDGSNCGGLPGCAALLLASPALLGGSEVGVVCSCACVEPLSLRAPCCAPLAPGGSESASDGSASAVIASLARGLPTPTGSALRFIPRSPSRASSCWADGVAKPVATLASSWFCAWRGTVKYDVSSLPGSPAHLSNGTDA